MNLRCIYCAHTWECNKLPPACPICATPFSLIVTPDTPLHRVVRALRKNGRSMSFDLRANMPEKHPDHMDVALACEPDEDTDR